MRRMILADDEPVIMRGIRKLVDWERLGFSIVGEYGDGSSAMEGLLSLRPDIALLDISMPGMNGIEILKNIREFGLPTRVIFISGFQDFEYARNALTYGAVAYLLKPVIREELLQAVEKAVGGMEEFQNPDVPAVSIPAQAENTFDSGFPASPVEPALARETAMPEETLYLPALAFILPKDTDSNQEQKLIRFSLISFLEEYLAENSLGILFSKNDNIVLVLKNMDSIRAKSEFSRLREVFYSQTGRNAAFVIGEQVGSMSLIPQQYRACLELSRYLFFADQIPIPILTAGEPVFSRKAGTNELSLVREQLLDSLLSQNREEFRKAYSRFCRTLCLASDGRKEDACYYFCSTVRRMEERLQEMRLSGKDANVGELLEQGRACSSFIRMSDFFGAFLEDYLNLLKNTMQNSEKKDLIRAKEYIEAHYRENLTLEVLAGEVHMNPYYFSSFFKKNAGENFKDYVNRVRLSHAVTLLVSTDMKTYEIAAEVGFRDARSFTEVFSRVYGETPSAYKKRVLGNGGDKI